MSLRLLEILLPSGNSADTVKKLLGDVPYIDIWDEEISEKSTIVKIIAHGEGCEEILDTLEQRFSSTEGFRIVLLPIEAVIPRPEEPEKEPARAGEEGKEKAVLKIGRISREELYADISDSATPSDFPGGKAGDVLVVNFTVCGVPCIDLNGGDAFKHSEAFSFQIATDDQAETDRYWNAIVSNGGSESACGWCKDIWGLSWQITPRVLTEVMAKGGDVAKRAFEAMMEMNKIDVAKIEAECPGSSFA